MNHFWLMMSIFGRERYDKGVMETYHVIKRLAEKLENGEFDFDDDGSWNQTDEDYERDVVNGMFVN